MLNELDAEVTEVNGVVDYKISPSNLHRVIQKQASQMGLTKQEKAMLSITGIDFTIPLLFNSASNRIQYVLQSLITNRIIKQKTAGQSSVLVSDVGLSNEDTDIVWTGDYDGSKPLQGARFENGVFKPAQIILPFKYKGLNLSDFIITDENGKRFLDTSRFDSELLKGYSVRIPTQLHSSMSMVEIVGFLPETEGDIVYAASAFIMQMGYSFNYAKLITLFNHYTISKIADSQAETNFFNFISIDQYEALEYEQKISLKLHFAEMNNLKYDANADKFYFLKLLKFKFQFDEKLLSATYEEEITYVEKLALASLNKKESVIQKQKERIESVRKVNPNYDEKLIERTNINYEFLLFSLKFRYQKKAYLQNKLNEIYFTVLSHKSVVKEIIKPNDAHVLKQIKESINSENPLFFKSEPMAYENLFISDRYQKDTFLYGQYGKKGIMSFSNFSVILTQIEGADIQLSNNYKIGFKHLKLSTNLSSSRSFDGELKIRINAEFQNACLDNVEFNLLNTFNIIPESFPTIQAMISMGADSKTILYFINHPQIRIIFSKYSCSKGQFGNFKSFNQIVTDYIIIKKQAYNEKKGLNSLYSKNIENNEIIQEAKNIIYNEFDDSTLLEITRGNYINKTLAPEIIDIVFLFWIKTLNEIGIKLGQLAKAFSSDSNGAGLNFQQSLAIQALRNEFLQIHSPFFCIKGIEKLNKGIKGIATEYSVVLSNKLYKNYHPPKQYNSILEKIFNLLGVKNAREKSTVEKEVKKALLAYEVSCIPGFINDPVVDRKRLFIDIETINTVKQHSIATIVLSAKKHPILSSNPFLSELRVCKNIANKPASITLNLLRKKTGSEINYVDGIYLLLDRELLLGEFNYLVNEGNRQRIRTISYTPYDLMLDLIRYELLRGNLGGKGSYFNIIPVDVLAILGISKVLRNANRLLQSGEYDYEEQFIQQFIENYSQERKRIVKNDFQKNYAK